ncbi:MAG TPA: hypothetical protein PKM25_19810, partial [Candidatus Ozemobacteraceae bacterium]|nr:hypothetical protein [Candidatus Ozemobacteraceae bacterium]
DVCERVCIMNQGRIILSDSLGNLLRTSQTRIAAVFSDAGAASRFAAGRSSIPHRMKDPGGVEFLLENAAGVNELIQAVLKADGTINEVAPVTLSLDQLFVRVLSGQRSELAGGNA